MVRVSQGRHNQFPSWSSENGSGGGEVSRWTLNNRSNQIYNRNFFYNWKKKSIFERRRIKSETLLLSSSLAKQICEIDFYVALKLELNLYLQFQPHTTLGVTLGRWPILGLLGLFKGLSLKRVLRLEHGSDTSRPIRKYNRRTDRPSRRTERWTQREVSLPII